MSQSPLSSLTALLLKAQHELQHSLGALNHPFDLKLMLDPTRETRSMSVSSERGGKTRFFVKEGARSYDLSLVLDPSDGGPKAALRLTDANGKVSEHHFVDAAQLTKYLPAEWQSLHKEVQEHLSRMFGPKFAALFQGQGAQAKPASTTATPAGAQENNATNQPVAADAAAQSAEATSAAGDTGAAHAAPASEPANADLLTVTVRREGARDLRFKGRLLAHVRTPLHRGRQHAYRVFRTEGGKIVAIKEGLSLWLNEHDRVEVQVYDDVEGVIAFFGFSPLAKALYAQLGMSEAAVETLD